MDYAVLLSAVRLEWHARPSRCQLPCVQMCVCAWDVEDDAWHVWKRVCCSVLQCVARVLYVCLCLCKQMCGAECVAACCRCGILLHACRYEDI